MLQEVAGSCWPRRQALSLSFIFFIVRSSPNCDTACWDGTDSFYVLPEYYKSEGDRSQMCGDFGVKVVGIEGTNLVKALSITTKSISTG